VKLVVEYALSFLGKPYKWAGDDPLAGWDCSGLVQEILASAGIDPPGDQTAQGLFDHFEKNGKYGVYGPGALAFFGESTRKISHVGFCLDTYRMVEAGGGGSKTLTEQDAITQNAFVRIRLIKARKDFQAVIMPFYKTIGVI
jgi:cell wall-associated NlpC family hydrolase